MFTDKRSKRVVLVAALTADGLSVPVIGIKSSPEAAEKIRALL